MLLVTKPQGPSAYVAELVCNRFSGIDPKDHPVMGNVLRGLEEHDLDKAMVGLKGDDRRRLESIRDTLNTGFVITEVQGEQLPRSSRILVHMSKKTKKAD